MKILVLKSKIHRAKVTAKNINYSGSITLDTELMRKAGLIEFEKVDVYNISNGERFSTYIIKGSEEKREVILNGAAARKVEVGDPLIIVSYAIVDEEEDFKPKIVVLDEENKIVD